MNLVINEQQVTFEAKDNQTFVTSRDIAAVFGKLHKNVLRDIEALPTDEFNQLNFEPVNYKDAKGETRKAYRLTRDGFALLAMGFTGEKAYQWKIAFIDGFNKMEAFIRNGGFEIPANYAEALQLAADQAREIDVLNAALEAAKPQIAFAKQIAQSAGTLSVRDFAKVLCKRGFSIGEKRLFRHLRNFHILDAHNKPYQKFVEMGIIELAESHYTNPTTGDSVLYTQPRITAKGQEYVHTLLVMGEMIKRPPLFDEATIARIAQ
jgi:anti-repressor protein